MAFDKELIKKYLNKECTVKEELEIEAYLILPEGEQALQEVMSEMLPLDIASFKTGLASNQQASTWIEKLHARINIPEQQPLLEKQVKRLSIIRYAAVYGGLILFASLFALMGINYSNKQKQLEIASRAEFALNVTNPNGRRSTITLSDGTVVNLGPGSKLSYPKSFLADTREVRLEGEAFFQVQKNPQKPFIVHTNDVQTKVLGTSFKVEAFKGEPLSVAVATGLVRVDQFKSGKLIKQLALLTPGKEVSWNEVTKVSAIADVHIGDITGWVNAKLIFNAKSLKTIAIQLERWYDVDIEFSNQAVAGKQITITLIANMPLNQIMQILGAGSGFHYKIKDKKITIY